jgi:hypothetical protein
MSITRRVLLKNIFLFTLILISSLGFKSLCQVDPAATGMRLFSDWTPDNTGSEDVSDKLQDAFNWCINNDKTLYIPPGTYLVSKTIIANVFPGRECGNPSGQGSLNVIGEVNDRPVIKLTDNAPGFNNTDISGNKPVFEFHQAERDAENCLFYSSVRNVNFDLGDGNTGAAAVYLAGAQDCDLSNITVYATGNFAAGFTGLPGRNANTANLEVYGGKYAFYIRQNSLGYNLTGARCINQSVAAIYTFSSRGTAITGLEIVNSPAPAIITEGFSGSPEAGNLVITDAKIEVNEDAYVFELINDRSIVLRNVYVKGTGKIARGNGMTWDSETTSGWTKINTFSWVPLSVGGANSYSLIDGEIKKQHKITDYEANISFAPDKLVIRNLPDTIYSFSFPGIVSIEDYGAVKNDGIDDLPAIQQAVNENAHVFIPQGKWHLNGKLYLRNHSVLIGDAGKRSDLVPINKPSLRTPMIETPDTDGYVVIQDMSFDTPDEDYYGAILWQTSTGFIYNIRNYLNPGRSEKDIHNFEFRGHAGGKFYAINDHSNILRDRTPHPDFRKIFIENTFNPISFYGLNLERGGDFRNLPQNPFFEAKRSQNIRIYGSKTEMDGTVYRFEDCRNISLNAFFSTERATVDPLIVLKDSDDIELCLLHSRDNRNYNIMIDDEAGDQVKRHDFVNLYRYGNFDLKAFDTIAVNYPPIADAGDDRLLDIIVTDSVLLNGQGVDDNFIAGYSWTKIEGPDCSLGDTSLAELKVGKLVAGEYVFELTVTDDSDLEDKDRVRVRVICSTCGVPEVQAGEDRFLYLPLNTVELNANAKDDGIISSYLWQQISGNALTIEGETTEKLILSGFSEGEYTFRITVTDDEGKSGYDDIKLTVINPPDSIPKIEADIRIDGRKEKTWEKVSFPLEAVIEGEPTGSAEASFFWDDHYLYSFISVKDENKFFDSGSDWQQDDAIVLLIDADNSKFDLFDENDFFYVFRWNDNTIYELVHNAKEGVLWVLNDTLYGYDLEVAFPWDKLNHTPVSMQEIGIEVQVQFDDNGGQRDAKIALSGKSGTVSPTPAYFDTFILDPIIWTHDAVLKKVEYFSVYPTITTSGIYIEPGSESGADCFIADQYGRILVYEKISTKRMIDISWFKAGIYFVTLKSGTYHLKTMMVIKK